MEIGVSTACFYPKETEKALERIVSQGVPCTEIFVNSFSEATPQFIKTYRSILASGDTKVISIHPFTSGMEHHMFFSNYERRLYDGLDMYKTYFNLAAEMNAKFVVIHGGSGFHMPDTDFYVERYGIVADCAKSFGVAIAHENVCRNMGKTPEIFRAIRATHKDASFVLDIKQVIRSGYAVDDYLEAMGSNIAHLHLSDSAKENDCLPVGKGTFDFQDLFDKLLLMGYKGDGVIELYGDSYKNEDDLWSSSKILKKYF